MAKIFVVVVFFFVTISLAYKVFEMIFERLLQCIRESHEKYMRLHFVRLHMLIQFWSDDTINFVVQSKRAQHFLNVIRENEVDKTATKEKQWRKATNEKKERQNKKCGMKRSATDESINWKKIWMITRALSLLSVEQMKLLSYGARARLFARLFGCILENGPARSVLSPIQFQYAASTIRIYPIYLYISGCEIRIANVITNTLSPVNMKNENVMSYWITCVFRCHCSVVCSSWSGAIYKWQSRQHTLKCQR